MTLSVIKDGVVEGGGGGDAETVDGLDSTDFVRKTGDVAETVTGVKTFSASPLVPAPTLSGQAASKGYVDGVAVGGSTITRFRTAGGPFSYTKPAGKTTVRLRGAAGGAGGGGASGGGASGESGGGGGGGEPILDAEVTVPEAETIYDVYVGAGGVQAFGHMGHGAKKSPDFHGDRNTGVADVTIFLVSGSLEITSDFTITEPDDTVVFVVNGNTYIDGNVENLEGVYINSQVFSTGYGEDSLTISGMVYPQTLNLERKYRSLANPAYKFIYQPKYTIALLPYLGRPQVFWKEVGP